MHAHSLAWSHPIPQREERLCGLSACE